MLVGTSVSCIFHLGSTVVHKVHIVSYMYMDCLACWLLLSAVTFPAYFYYLIQFMGTEKSVHCSVHILLSFSYLFS